MIEEIKTPAKASESYKTILPTINKDVKHLEELRAYALDYVSKGYPIVPMGCNKLAHDYKLPLIRWREAGPLKTETEVNQTFSQLGSKVFGIATIVDGYTLVDFDTKDSQSLFKGLEPTPTIETGKGFHMWYAANDSLKQNGPVDLSYFEKRDGKKYQMEVYTSNRLEILPPSKHHFGVAYEWTVDLEDFPDFPPLPEAIASLCNKGKASYTNTLLAAPVFKGERHSAVVKVATQLARKYKGDFSKLEKVVLKWNSSNCNPPLEETEVENIIKWASETYVDFDETEGGGSKVKKLYKLLNESSNIELFHDQNEVGYARIHLKGRAMNVPVKSTEFKEFIRFEFYQTTKESLSNILIDEALGFCNAKAVYEGKQHSLYHRVAQENDTFYYDLMNDDGEIVKIDETGWSLIPGSEKPFLFKIGCGVEQVRPVKGGNLKNLLELMNIGDQDEQMLLICTLPVRLIREVDQAIVYVYGPAGSGKTTILKMIKDLLDPSAGGISMPIKKVDDAIPHLNKTWLFANDNISKINDELSDFLCVVATGAENSRRTLYTNGDITVFSVKNPTYLTGVNVEAYRSDLMSRMLLFKTDAVPAGKRYGSNELRSRYEEMKPVLLGALFDTLSKAIQTKKRLNLKTEFRMADFSLWGAACAEALGYGADNFEKAVQKAMKFVAYDAVYSFSAGRALLELLETDSHFEGTATDLLNKLKKTESNFEWSEEVARNPASLGKKLRELENSLAELGITIDYGKRCSAERTIVIDKRTRANDRMTDVTD